MSVWKKCRWGYEGDEERMRVTVLFRNASASCSAPLSPILFPVRSSVVSACVKKCIWEYERDDERMRVTVLFRNASARCCAPRPPIWLLLRCSVVSVCVKKCIWGYEREMTRECRLPCYFVMRQPDVVLRELRFDCCRDLVWWVSVWKSADGNMRERWRENGGYRVI